MYILDITAGLQIRPSYLSCKSDRSSGQNHPPNSGEWFQLQDSGYHHQRVGALISTFPNSEFLNFRSVGFAPLSRICNPTAPSMSICNAANKVRKRKILSHCKCLYSKRSDCKFARASYAQNPPELAMPRIRPSCKSDRAVTLFMESKISFFL